MKIIILPPARLELRKAVLHYNRQREGLGAELRDEVRRAAQSLVANHQLYRLRHGDYRRVNLRKFPYYLVYFIRQDKILINAITHASRDPEYWLDRPLP
ncbi:MAG: type II toxin-antitoxin system RelE/ParE family toxin [Verrucomicrobiales bacterium]|jgi:plasmid stabilization system protein ParE|nr:type II toxin-antitoxin system RelE/ParE family toxin [Verrucomicrobiales bacterium]